MWNKLKMKNYTAEGLFEECKKLFPCYSYNDLSKIKSDRTGEYEIKFAPNIEADEEYKNISANEINEKGIKGITLEERLLLEIQYLKETGKHLDIDNLTLCAGSRSSDGGVPYVCWRGGRLRVYGCDPGSRCDSLRARATVLPSSLSPFDPSLLTFEYQGKKYKLVEN